MQLTLRGEEVIQEPDNPTIEQAIGTLDGGDDSFAILEDPSGQSAELYIQAAGGPEDFIIEYAEAVAEHGDEIKTRLFRANREVSPETVVVMFQSYAQGDGTWKGMVAWEDTSIEGEAHQETEHSGDAPDPWAKRGGCFGLLSLLSLALVTVGLVLTLGIF